MSRTDIIVHPTPPHPPPKKKRKNSYTVPHKDKQIVSEDSWYDMSQNIHQTQPVMEALQKSKRLLPYVCSYGSFGNPSIVEGTAFFSLRSFESRYDTYQDSHDHICAY